VVARRRAAGRAPDQLGVTTLTPVVPLMLTMISREELLMKLLAVIF
jgi:hypothetical protein